MSSFDKYLEIYNKTRDIERAAKMLKQHKSVDMIKEAYELTNADLPKLLEELRKQGVGEKRITEICGHFYGFFNILSVLKGKEAVLLANLQSGKANITHKNKNCWIDRGSEEYAYFIKRLEEKVSSK